jgi:hypothetical protein
MACGHPPLEGEGRIAGGDPGWGDGEAAFAALLSPPTRPAEPTSPLQGEVFEAQKSGLSAFGISDTDASNAILFSAQMVSSIPPLRVRR